MKKVVKVFENQSIFDISIQVYGSIESIFELLQDNGSEISNLTSTISAGAILNTDRNPKDSEMVNYYKVNEYYPANGVSAPGTLPPPVFTGDYNNDYNNDYYN